MNNTTVVSPCQCQCLILSLWIIPDLRCLGNLLDSQDTNIWCFLELRWKHTLLQSLVVRLAEHGSSTTSAVTSRITNDFIMVAFSFCQRWFFDTPDTSRKDASRCAMVPQCRCHRSKYDFFVRDILKHDESDGNHLLVLSQVCCVHCRSSVSLHTVFRFQLTSKFDS